MVSKLYGEYITFEVELYKTGKILALYRWGLWNPGTGKLSWILRGNKLDLCREVKWEKKTEKKIVALLNFFKSTDPLHSNILLVNKQIRGLLLKLRLGSKTKKLFNVAVLNTLSWV